MDRPVIWFQGTVTAVTGYGLLGLGIVTGLLSPAFGSSLLESAPIQSGTPIQPAAPVIVWSLVAVAVLFVGVGAAFVHLSFPLRAREDDDRRDGLLYPPSRPRPRYKLLWSAAVAFMIVFVLLGLAFVPVSQPAGLSLPAVTCGSGPPTALSHLSLPQGSVFIYNWHSSDGRIVGKVWAPGASTAVFTSNGSSSQQAAFGNSSSGNGKVVVEGSPLDFAACDFPGTPMNGSGQSVIVTGTDYTTTL